MNKLATDIQALSSVQRTAFFALLSKKGVDVLTLPIFPANIINEPPPLSYAQQRLWFLDQFEPGNPFYNMLAAVRLHGALDAPALRRSLDEIVR
jgi:hypothetical protein